MNKFKLVEGPESIQGSPQWLQFRKGKIGASMAASILGIDPWRTRLQLWEEIIFDRSKPKTQAMQRGNDFEEEARNWLNEMWNFDFSPAVIQSKEYPFLISSLDGYFIDQDGQARIAEIKVPGRNTHEGSIDGKIPDHYYAQMQHQMMLTDVRNMVYCSYSDGNGVILNCLRNDKYCSDLLEKELEFFKSIVDFEPPPPSDKDWKELTDPRCISKLQEYEQLDRQMKSIEQEMEGLRDFLISNADFPRLEYGNSKIQKIQPKGSYNYRRHMEELELPLDDKYIVKKKEYWTIRCK